MKNKSTLKPTLLVKKAKKALKAAAARAIEEHIRAGHPLIVWKKGKVIRVPAKSI
jgi:hypothetical protein